MIRLSLLLAWMAPIKMSNTGLGYQIAKELAKLKPKVIIMACRDQTRALNAIESIRVDVETKTDNLVFMALDLNDLASV